MPARTCSSGGGGSWTIGRPIWQMEAGRMAPPKRVINLNVTNHWSCHSPSHTGRNVQTLESTTPTGHMTTPSGSRSGS